MNDNDYLRLAATAPRDAVERGWFEPDASDAQADVYMKAAARVAAAAWWHLQCTELLTDGTGRQVILDEVVEGYPEEIRHKVQGDEWRRLVDAGERLPSGARVDRSARLGRRADLADRRARAAGLGWGRPGEHRG